MNREIDDVADAADRALGNDRPTSQERRELGRQQRAATIGRVRDGVRDGTPWLGEQGALQEALYAGAPKFPHHTSVILTILTCGLFGPIYWANWMVSKRRRYLRERRAVLRAQGFNV